LIKANDNFHKRTPGHNAIYDCDFRFACTPAQTSKCGSGTARWGQIIALRKYFRTFSVTGYENFMN